MGRDAVTNPLTLGVSLLAAERGGVHLVDCLTSDGILRTEDNHGLKLDDQVRLYIPPRSYRRLTFANVDGGTFRLTIPALVVNAQLTLPAQQTGAIAWSATTATLLANIKAALEALGRVVTALVSDIDLSGGNGSCMFHLSRMNNAYDNSQAAQAVTIDSASLTGGGAALTAPALGLAGNTTYHVIATNLASRTFQVSATQGGAAIAFTADIRTAWMTSNTVEAKDACALAAFDSHQADIVSRIGLTNAVTLATSAAADDIIDTATAHGFAVNDKIVFVTRTGGTGIRLGRTYHVIATSLAAQTFKFSETQGGSAVDLGSDITAGTVMKLNQSRKYWPPIFGYWTTMHPSSSVWGVPNLPSEALMEAVADRNAVLMLHWTATSGGGDLAGGFDLTRITGGEFDSHISDLASLINGVADPVIVRWGWEMNGSWFPWAIGGSAGNTTATFKAAWRYIHTMMRDGGAANAMFLWCPHNKPADGWGRWYPGNAYVDYVGVDAYAWAPENGLPVTTSLNSDDVLRFTKPHGLVPGRGFTFRSLTGGSNLATATPYYVLKGTGFTRKSFRFSTTRGGAAVNFGSDITAGSIVPQPLMHELLKPCIEQLRRITGSTRPVSQAGAKQIIIGEIGVFGESARPNGTTIVQADADGEDAGDIPTPYAPGYAAVLEEAELASADSDDEAVFRRQWLARGLRQSFERWHDLVGFVYFDCAMDTYGTDHPNWRFSARPPILAKWAKALNKKRYRGDPRTSL